jgi:hypothetical protein
MSDRPTVSNQQLPHVTQPSVRKLPPRKPKLTYEYKVMGYCMGREQEVLNMMGEQGYRLVCIGKEGAIFEYVKKL